VVAQRPDEGLQDHESVSHFHDYAPSPQSEPLHPDETLENETLRASVFLCETSTGQNITILEASPNNAPPRMHPVHNDQTVQTNLSGDGHAVCAENAAAEKQPDHAYAVVPSPPETTVSAQALGTALPYPMILAEHFRAH
jgi:hypothetical protein